MYLYKKNIKLKHDTVYVLYAIIYEIIKNKVTRIKNEYKYNSIVQDKNV